MKFWTQFNKYLLINFKVLDNSICPFFLEKRVKSEGQNFEGNTTKFFMPLLHIVNTVLSYFIFNFLTVSHDLLFFFSSQKVDYPLELDVFDLCSDDLRKQLEAPRLV